MRRMVPVLSLMSLLVGGCAAPPVTLDAWQRSAEQYVWDAANGDPTALRNMRTDAGRYQFSVIAYDHPDESVDVVGVLLGHERVADRDWFIFLVGQVERREVTDIRVAAVAAEGGAMRWRVGEPDDESLEIYRRHRAAVRHEAAPDRDEPPIAYHGWPEPDDRYTLEVDGPRVHAVEAGSGARWSLTLTEPVAARSSHPADNEPSRRAPG